MTACVQRYWFIVWPRFAPGFGGICGGALYMGAPESCDDLRDRWFRWPWWDGPARGGDTAAVQPPRHQGSADRCGEGDAH